MAKKIIAMDIKKTIGWFSLYIICLIFSSVVFSCPSNAAVPGDACGVSNAISYSGGPEASGASYVMVCSGGVWVRIFETDANGNIGVRQNSPVAALHIGGEVIIGSTSGLACSSATEGAIRYNDSQKNIEICNGTDWALVSASTNAPLSFSFTDQTGVVLDTTISSNAVTLYGFTGIASAVCGSGCTSIAKNGVWGGASVSGFQAGDSIAIRQMSSATPDVTTTAVVTVGSTTSSTWSVTTSDSTPDAISFTDQSGVETEVTVTSDDVTLSGFTGAVTATCGGSCIAIAQNGVWGGTSFSGFESGDTIAIRLNTASTTGTATTAYVTVGTTVSSTWTVTTQ